jgi:hypothetical protein
LAARLLAVLMTSAAHGSQPARPARRAAVGQQDQRGHDIDAINRQRERVSMLSGLPVHLSELPHMAIAGRSGNAGQADDGCGGGPVDPAVDRVDSGRRSGAADGGGAVSFRGLSGS